MSEENKAILRRLDEEVWNKGELSAVDELCTPDLVIHKLPPGMPSGSEGVKAMVSTYRGAFPDLKVANDFVLAEVAMVASGWTVRGTQNGELMGIPATGKQIEITGITVARIAGGKIVEMWNESDQLDLMQQLGVISL